MNARNLAFLLYTFLSYSLFAVDSPTLSTTETAPLSKDASIFENPIRTEAEGNAKKLVSQHLAEISQLHTNYIAALNEREKVAKQSADLTSVVEIQAEKARFAASKDVPDPSTTGNKEIRRLQDIFKTKRITINKAMNDRTLKLAEWYQSRLKTVQDEHTKAGRIEEALLVNAEIKRVAADPCCLVKTDTGDETKLKKLNETAEPVTEDTPKTASPSIPTPSTIASGAKQITIPANREVGYIVGPMKKGSNITLKYVSGKWKSWGTVPTEDPDSETTERGDAARLVIASQQTGQQSEILAIVPAQTAQNPFTYTFTEDYANILLRINDCPGQTSFASNPGSVVYSITLGLSRLISQESTNPLEIQPTREAQTAKKTPIQSPPKRLIKFPPSLRNGMVLFYEFSNDTSPKIKNSVLTMEDGSVKDATWDSEGKFGGAYSFADAGGRIQIKSPKQIRDSFTIAAWVYPTKETPLPTPSATGQGALDGLAYVFAPKHGGEDGKSAGIGLSVGKNGAIVSEQAAVHLPAVLTYQHQFDSTWHHFAVVVSGGQAVLYVDGQMAQQGVKSTRSRLLCPEELGIGGWRDRSIFSGKIDDVAVWSRNLSAAEIKVLYQQ